MPKTKPTIVTGRKFKGIITMSNKMDPVIHFELPAEDTERVRKFYESAFGWQTTNLDPEI